jgi:hypothetical protein
MKFTEPQYDEKGIKLPLCQQPAGVKFKPSQIGIWARKSDYRKSAYPWVSFSIRYRQPFPASPPSPPAPAVGSPAWRRSIGDHALDLQRFGIPIKKALAQAREYAERSR